MAVCSSTGKQQLTHNRAEKAARKSRRVNHDNCAHYMCRDCGWWHVGHLPPSKRVRMVRGAKMRRRRSTGR